MRRWIALLPLVWGCGARSGLGDGELLVNPDSSPADTAISLEDSTVTVETSPADTCICAVGAEERGVESCAPGEDRVRVCESSCAWGPWSECLRRGWLPIASADAYGLQGRYRHDAVWTGREMIVYGGSPVRTEGAIYDPAVDKWRALPPSGLPFAPKGLVVWAGDRMFIFTGDDKAGQGAEYDPNTDRWVLTPPTPIGARKLTTARYLPGTGEVVIWGGADKNAIYTERGDGAAYRVASRTWRKLAPSPLSARGASGIVASSTRLFVFGGQSGTDEFRGDGAAWDALTDTWTYVPTTSLGGRRFPHAASDGELHFFFGGFARPGDPSPTGARFEFAALATKLTSSSFDALGGGGAGTPESAVWAGAGRLWSFGGSLTFAPDSDRGASYEPRTDTWTALPPGGPAPRSWPTAVWTGREAIVWGGCCSETGAFADGAMYRP